MASSTKSAPKKFPAKRSAKSTAVNSPIPAAAEKQLSTFIAKFSPEIAKRIRDSRTILRKRFPTAHEIVYDNYNFFVIGYTATEKASTCLVSIAANSKGVGLSFYWGATLPDPHKILKGSGTQNRFVQLPTAQALLDPKVTALIDAAEAQAKTPLPKTPGRLIIKSISAKQRPRR